MKQLIFSVFVFVFFATSCEKEIASDSGNDGNVTLTFRTTTADVTRGACAEYFQKLNVQVFDAMGAKVFDKVKTQTSADADFGSLSVRLGEGTYTVVAVGHSSSVSATIKSPTVCQFTASDGRKLTDTFCACQQIVVDGSATDYTFDMYRAVAMVQLCLQDDDVPANFAQFKMEYSGGSANFNPTTLEGITKSSQSELRTATDAQIYQAFTFPYLSASGVLKMTCTALDAAGGVIRQREWQEVPVTRNRITTYTGKFFEDGDGQFTQTDFGFVVHADWEGEDTYNF